MDAVDLDVEVLSERLGANRSTIYHWRKGTRIPSPGIQSDLARQLGVSVAELNGWAA
jgi:DNA-binding transcriptional regulator YiaG